MGEKMKPSAVIALHRENGIETLRARFNYKYTRFELVKSTLSGGWAKYGTRRYYTIEEANQAASELAAAMPQHYRVDDGATEYVKLKSYRDAKKV